MLIINQSVIYKRYDNLLKFVNKKPLLLNNGLVLLYFERLFPSFRGIRTDKTYSFVIC